PSAPPVGRAPAVTRAGNPLARVSISREGKEPGVPDGSPKETPGANGPATGSSNSTGGTSAGNSVADISIRGGNPPANKGMSGLGEAEKITAPTPHTLITRPKTTSDDEAVRTARPNFTALPPGAKPEEMFDSKKIYKMQIDMPNLNSATGSWILNFTELRSNADAPRVPSSDLSGPSPIRGR